jgi:hypothetical protein
MHYTLRIASAMCFIGHGAFGILTKPIWCNYFAVFGIGHDTAYRLMPFVGTVDILLGISLLFYPVRAVAAWLVCWGIVTATLRPLSGEPFAELVERAGNFGAPLALLLLSGPGGQGFSRWWSRISAHPAPDVKTFSRVVLFLRVAVFLLLLGHGWLNWIGKKGLLQQYTGLGFSNPVNVAHAAGLFEMIAAAALLIKPVRPLLAVLFLWKVSTELFYPHYELFEWVERGGSYGSLLALWFALEKSSVRINQQIKTELKMRNIVTVLVLLVAIFSAERTSAQGCVAIRSTGGFCTAGGEHHMDTVSKWQFTMNNRYYKSFRHYIGTEQQKQRIALGNNVINHANTTDLAIYRLINPRWSIMLDMPISANARSQTYTEKGSLYRFSTHSFGVGDIRFAVYSWIIDPMKMPKGNIQVGLGIKLPTGADNFQDYFKTSDSTKTFGPVDQSIQLGDGGTGFTTEVNAFYNFSRVVSVYGNFYYLFNPRDQNGVSNAHGATPSAASVQNGSNIMSVPDQLMARAGVNLMFSRWNISAGLRDECLPVRDLIGKSDGFRRPGYILSAEPGVTYVLGKASIYAFVPIALVRNRTQSVPDKITTQLTGVYTHGDAAFADYAINIGANIRF